jgi:iron(III) transport system permease protein
MVLIFVPPYVHAMAWIRFTQAWDDALRSSGLAPVFLTGWPGAFWIQLMAYLPASLAFAHVGFAMCDRVQVDAARMFATDWRVFRDVERPQLLPAAAIGAALVFILSVTDYSVPSIMQREVYALEAFVEYSVAADSTASFVVALPLLAVSALVAALAVERVGRLAVNISFAGRGERAYPSTLPTALRAFRILAIAVCVAQFAVPTVTLVAGAGSPSSLLAAWGRSSREIVTSLAVAGSAASLSILLALLVAPRLTSLTRLAVVVIPLAIPGSIVGVGLLKMWTTPGMNAVYGTLALPVLAMIARYSSLAILVMNVQSKRIDPLLIDAARLFRGDGLAVWLMVRLPLSLPGALVGFFCVFGLALSELNASILVAPPGQQTLSTKIFSLLHYGASGDVTALCLLTMAASVVSILTGYLAGRLWRRTPETVS